MKIRIFIALLVCRLSRFAIRLLGRGGTDLPGRLALRICPRLLEELSKGVDTIIITGTNGKTTTSRMVEQCMKEAGLSFFCNKSGANLLSGITTEFAMNAGPLGRPRRAYALIECDEAAFKQVGLFTNPKVIAVTNIFRDQLDRYGEIGHTLKSIKIGLENSPRALVCLNADCSLTASLAKGLDREIVWFGVEAQVYSRRVDEVSDAKYCIFCNREYSYDYVTYGHLGAFRCEGCGYRKPETQVSVTEVLLSDADHSVIELRLGENRLKATLNLPGGYNIYNAAAAAACCQALGIGETHLINALADFECGFGRMEKLRIEGVDLRMILVKNPAGCNQVLSFLSSGDESLVFVALLNDRTADGRDISWIWDVDFEILADFGQRLPAVYVSGIRAEELALRLLYAGLDREKIRLIKDHDSLLQAALSHGEQVYIMPTYTAMLELRKGLSKKYGLKDFWE